MKKWYVLATLVLVILIAVYLYADFSRGSCIQVPTTATNRITGKVETFGNPCDVPFWYKDVTDHNPGKFSEETNNMGTENIVIDESKNATDNNAKVSAFLELLSRKYEGVFSEQNPYNFEWRWRDPSLSSTTHPNISMVNGRAMYISDLSLQDLQFGERSVLFQLNKTLPLFFEQEGFRQAIANDSDHPTKASSVIGYESTELGVVCVRIIEDNESEFITYQIACGSDPSNH